MRRLIYILAILNISTTVYSQDINLKRISLHRDNLHPKEFIALVESEYHLTFYYNPAWLVDSMRSDAHYQDVELLTAVQDYFVQFGIGIYDDLPDIYLTAGELPKKAFARDFFKSLNTETQIPVDSSKGVTVTGIEEVLNVANSESLDEEVQFGHQSPNLAGNKFYIRGLVLDAATSEGIIGATIQATGASTGTVTNVDGQYSLVIPYGKNEIIYRAVGKKTVRRMVTAYDNGKLDVSLYDDINMLDQITIIGQTDDKIGRMDGAEKMDMLVLNKSIMILGETDILKGLLTMPGVQAASEVSTGYNVRGGTTDQNLVLLDDAPIMNMTHFFGFFSNINADVVQNTELYKSGMPSSIGGRISSILEVETSTGDYEKYHANGGISPVSAHLKIDGPILKNKVSFIGAGRTTYSDWILRKVGDQRVRNSSASFYDYFAKLGIKLKNDQQLSFSFYTSHDYFKFDKIQTQVYSNLAFSSVYTAQFGTNLAYKANVSYSSYNSGMIDETIPSISSRSSYNIDQYSLNNRFNWNKNRWMNLSFGLSGIYYDIQPGRQDPFGAESIVEPMNLDNERAIEGSLYLQNEQTVNSWLELSYGLRFSAYGFLGPADIYAYKEGVSRSPKSLTDTISYTNGKLIKTYSGPEFRFLGKILIDAKSSFKFSYNRTRQYIGLISNTVLPAPTDFWKLSNPHIQPRIADIVSLGYFRNIVLNPASSLVVSLEAYHRNTENILDYKTGAELFANEHFETEIIQGTNRSYGIEFQVKRDKGNLTGWLNYTYARSLNKFQSELPEEQINAGTYFPANYDKPHQINLVANYDIYRRLRVSTNIHYSTGRPITLPETAFIYRGSKRIQFSDRNQFRLDDYFRLDMSATWEGNYRTDKWIHSSFILSVVNLTGRDNPYSVFFDYDKGKLKAYSLSIYGVPIFTLTYKFEF